MSSVRSVSVFRWTHWHWSIPSDYSCGEKGEFQAAEIDNDVYQVAVLASSEEEFLRLPCFSHCLQLVVNDGIKASGAALSALKKVAELAKPAHSSTIFFERLEKARLTIPKANRTRWNSHFHTVKKVINISPLILAPILSDLKKNGLIMNSKERRMLEEFVSLFELFNEATVSTQGESYATISPVAPTVLGILFDLERERSSSSLILVSVCDALISLIKARFSWLLRHCDIDVPFDCHCMSERFSDVIFLISPLFDTRFKLLWLDHLQTVVKMRVLEKLQKACVRFFSQIASQNLSKVVVDASNEAEKSNTDATALMTNSPTKRKCLFPYRWDNKMTVCDDKTKILMELDAFLCEESCETIYFLQRRELILHYINLAWNTYQCQQRPPRPNVFFLKVVLLCAHTELL